MTFDELFKCPLRVEETSNDDINVIDSTGVVVLKLNWLSDLNHVRTQKERGEAIVSLINGGGEQSSNNFCVESNGHEKKRRGNPAWVKGMKRPEGAGRKTK